MGGGITMRPMGYYITRYYIILIVLYRIIDNIFYGLKQCLQQSS